jgi:hypothetical protein
MRGFSGLLVLGLALACGFGETDDPDPDPKDDPADIPDPKPEKDPPPDKGKRKKAKSQRCLKGVIGVLAGMPGMPAGDGYQKPVHKGPLEARAKPEEGANPLYTFTSEGIDHGDELFCSRYQCEGIGFAYETEGLPVYGVKKGWAKVGISKDRMTLDATCDIAFVPVSDPPEVLKLQSLLGAGHWSSPLDNWDGKVADSAGGTLKKAKDLDDVVFDMTATKRVDGALWIQADFLRHPCEDFKKKLGKGWVPVLNEAGELQIQLYLVC